MAESNTLLGARLKNLTATEEEDFVDNMLLVVDYALQADSLREQNRHRVEFLKTTTELQQARAQRAENGALVDQAACSLEPTVTMRCADLNLLPHRRSALRLYDVVAASSV